MFYLYSPFLLLFSLWVTGCSLSSESDSSTTDPGGKSDSAVALKQVATEQQLLELIRSGLANREAEPQFYIMEMAQDSAAAAPTATATATNTGESGRSVSTTNLQVEGVDEADIIKSDGDRLYRVAPSEPIYYPMAMVAETTAEPEPASVTAIAPSPSSESGNRLQIYQLDAATPAQQLLAEVAVGETDDPQLSGIYLLDQQRLVLIYGQRSGYWGMWWSPWQWQQGKSVVEVVDFSQPQSPQLEQRYEIEGYLIATRRIGSSLYLASRFTPAIEGYLPYAYSDEDIAKNESLVAAAGADELLPKISVNATSKPLVSEATAYQPPGVVAGEESPDLVTLLEIDLDSATSTTAQWRSQTLLGTSETLFMTHNAAYFATALAEYSSDSDGLVRYTPDWTSAIHKFALTSDGPLYRGSGSVTGHLGWDNEKKPFRMGEIGADGESLGIVTSEGESWSGDSSTRITLLQEGEGDELTLISTLGGLGKPGEQLYAARFQGDRAYLVTFRVTDPLYVIDLSQPESLNLEQHVGSLEIPGYSDYLHPVDDNTLLGLGKDAVADSAGGDNDRGAWAQGVKLALFDVTDLHAPQLLDSVVIGKRGSESAAIQDHHAFTWLGGDSATGRLPRLALPIQLHETSGRDGSYYSEGDPRQWYDWTRTALYQFEISATSITAVGELVAEAASGESYSYPQGSLQQDRAVMVDDSLYYSHGDALFCTLWGSSAHYCSD
ncbi:MAG: beta-propeller domain-containing protein [Gammaproteobacteria bacterium]|nr:beta-propeller domain-containing protein [Gammaproteobacteria bacterium]